MSIIKSEYTHVMSASDMREIKEAVMNLDVYMTEALLSLERLAHGAVAPQAVIELLRQEPFTDIPARYRQNVNTSGACTSSSRAGSPMREITYNNEYDRRVAERTAPGVFRVPVERALPISYEAQCDLRHVTGERRRSSLHLESGYAALFTKSASRGRELSPDEEARLDFLQAKEDNPRRVVEERLREKHAYVRRSDPTARQSYNEPKVLPNLHKKARPDFLPQCVDRHTVVSEVHIAGNQERKKAAAAAVNGKAWV
ncbi:hypothetical protein STCU_06747 [Strigomonas culicis]|uniref:Uncharacterized protein n=1 Tax=Strigomonas culicis TaxID=28005 RepID=S9VEG9_9TRYP|nr:hypothetical protein STCU_06747 [Strigomonas culicis]|eukprot:EPY25496.1 hypothetical protein STCU_06747 [Strigomonas culicis]